jgi:hydroxymethylbilane synthase
LRKLVEENLDAVILATAGLRRLGRAAEITAIIPETEMLPAIGQGALGLEYRQDDAETRNLLEFLDHPETKVAVAAERAFLARLEGGCQVPIAAKGSLKNGELILEGLIGDLTGTRIYREQVAGPPEAAEHLGRELAQRLLQLGGAQILSEIYGRVFE